MVEEAMNKAIEVKKIYKPNQIDIKPVSSDPSRANVLATGWNDEGGAFLSRWGGGDDKFMNSMMQEVEKN